MTVSSLTVTDNRTGKSYEIPIANGAIRAVDLRQIRTGPEDFGLLSYHPAFTNTASCISRITEIDGERGILRYRGDPIEELAERSNYLEVAYLVLDGELPTMAQMDEWVYDVTQYTLRGNQDAQSDWHRWGHCRSRHVEADARCRR